MKLWISGAVTLGLSASMLMGCVGEAPDAESEDDGYVYSTAVEIGEQGQTHVIAVERVSNDDMQAQIAARRAMLERKAAPARRLAASIKAPRTAAETAVPSRVSTRLTEISAYWFQGPPARRALLSNTSSTLARWAGLRVVVPLKMTSCMDSPRSSLALDSPSTQRTASMMFDLPQPFGPTTPTSWPGSRKLVGSAKDLKPESLMELRRTARQEKHRYAGTRAG